VCRTADRGLTVVLLLWSPLITLKLRIWRCLSVFISRIQAWTVRRGAIVNGWENGVCGGLMHGISTSGCSTCSELYLVVLIFLVALCLLIMLPLMCMLTGRWKARNEVVRSDERGADGSYAMV
jgi:hypothetical protein